MHIPRSLPVLAATLAAPILMAGGLVLSPGTITAYASVRHAEASAPSVSPDFTCSAGNTCFFSGDNYNDNWWELPNSVWGGDVVYNFADIGISPNPGSAHMDGGSTLWLENTSDGHKKCVYNGKIVLDHDYDEFWINYGVDTC